MKKYLFSSPALFLYGIFFLAIAAFILRLSTPPELQIPESNFVGNQNEIQTQFEGLEFTGSEKIPSQQLPIAEVTPFESTRSSIANSFSQHFELKETEYEGVWQGTEYNMMLDRGRNEYTLFPNVNPSETETTNIVDLEKAITAADQIVINYFPSLSLKLSRNSVRYYNDTIEQYAQVNPEEASLVVLPYSYTIADYPVFYQKESQHPFLLYINGDYALSKLSFFPQFGELKTIAKKNTLSSDQALARIISDDKASIISASNQELEAIDFSQIKGGLLDEVSLEYRIDPELNLAYPFYRFSGRVTDQNNSVFDSEIITPAIELEIAP